jgi:uncharacterized protein (TIGR02444 family)
MTALPLTGPHWSFAVELYGRPGVSEACLALQDRLGVDVNVLLFALFAAIERGAPVSERDIEDMDRTVAAWRNEIVLTLRGVRRRLKNGPEPAPNAVTETLREQVKRAELGAEQIEQAVLARWLDQRLPGGQAQHGIDIDVAGVAARVVDYFARHSGTLDQAATPDVQNAVQAVVQATAGLDRRGTAR